MKTTIRRATPSETEDVLRVNRAAFGDDKGTEVSDLVAGLLADPTAEPRLSLLAIHKGEAVGHILFTLAQLPESEDSIRSAILAPLAVVPEYQSKGIGGALIKEGLSLLNEDGIHLVFVLGHPGYYPRHGFRPACPLGLFPLYHEPGTANDAWMVQELVPGALHRAKGTVTCADTLDELRHWRE